MYLNETQNQCDVAGCGRIFTMGADRHEEAGFELFFQVDGEEVCIDMCTQCADPRDITTDEAGWPALYVHSKDGFDFVDLSYAEVRALLPTDWQHRTVTV